MSFLFPILFWILSFSSAWAGCIFLGIFPLLLPNPEILDMLSVFLTCVRCALWSRTWSVLGKLPRVLRRCPWSRCRTRWSERGCWILLVCSIGQSCCSIIDFLPGWLILWWTWGIEVSHWSCLALCFSLKFSWYLFYTLGHCCRVQTRFHALYSAGEFPPLHCVMPFFVSRGKFEWKFVFLCVNLTTPTTFA